MHFTINEKYTQITEKKHITESTLNYYLFFHNFIKYKCNVTILLIHIGSIHTYCNVFISSISYDYYIKIN